MHPLEITHTHQDKWRLEPPWLAFILSYAEGTARAAVAEGEARRRRPAEGRPTELARERYTISTSSFNTD